MTKEERHQYYLDHKEIYIQYSIKSQNKKALEKNPILLWRYDICNLKNRKDKNKICPKLGYSYNQLFNHLESLFKPGMTRDNYGSVWCIDHIISLYIFDKDTDTSVVNALSNLQPLFYCENREKYSKEIEYKKTNQTDW